MTRTPAAWRALALFSNFFLVILAYYQVKPASRSLYLEHFNAAQLPYVWIASAIVLALLMPAYAQLINRVSRVRIVIGSCGLFAVLLLGFAQGLGGPAAAVGFYILVDILSVVLVEQFWSLTNSAFVSAEGRRWYGLIGSGGLLGGLVGGQLANLLLAQGGLSTIDLLYVAAALLVLIAGLASLLARLKLFVEAPAAGPPPALPANARPLDWLRNRYLLTITATLLLAQIVEPIIEYQFMHYVSLEYPGRDERTAFLSRFLSWLGGIALAINLLITPLLLRRLGAISGMLCQPIALLLGSVGFASSASLLSGAALKISDRGLSYSINRAAKELLYVPVDPALIYKAKAWIDMFGYRAFKVLGAVSILALSQWTGLLTEPQSYSPGVIVAALLWIGLILSLARPYQELIAAERRAQQAAAPTPVDPAPGPAAPATSSPADRG